MAIASKTQALMKRTDTSNADPKLAPKLERARSKLLSGLGHLSLIDAFTELRSAMEAQKSEDSRLANLSAQTWVLRRRLEALQAGDEPNAVQNLLGRGPETMSQKKLMAFASAGPVVPEVSAVVEPIEKGSSEAEPPNAWRKVKILAEAEVNGMMFFEGSILAVKPNDALRLVEAGKAEIIEAVSVEPTTAPNDATASKGRKTPKVGK